MLQMCVPTLRLRWFLLYTLLLAIYTKILQKEELEKSEKRLQMFSILAQPKPVDILLFMHFQMSYQPSHGLVR